MSEELKPCPFCGVVPRVGYDGTSYFINCGGKNCLIRPSIILWEKEDVIREWNTRKGEQ